MKETYVHADSPVDVGALIASVPSQNLNQEAFYLGVSGGSGVTFNLPAIADLPGAFNQKINIVLLDDAANATIQPAADDTLCTVGTGISLVSGASNFGASYVLSVAFDGIWHVSKNDASAFT